MEVAEITIKWYGFLITGVKTYKVSFIDEIREKIKEGKYFMSQHAVVESAKDMVDDEDIAAAIVGGELIEDYPDDKRGHSCLICGMMKDRRCLHIVAGMAKENAVIITTYLPSSDKWETTFKRRKNNG